MTYLLWISYKGTNYAGFQVQPNAPTVCAVLQDAMQAVLGQRPDVKGCSRTDAGVHARRFALSFCYTGRVPMQKLVPALNAHLPPDIRAVDIQPVPDSFHARYAAHAKTYHYYLLNARVDDPFLGTQCEPLRIVLLYKAEIYLRFPSQLTVTCTIWCVFWPVRWFRPGCTSARPTVSPRYWKAATANKQGRPCPPRGCFWRGWSIRGWMPFRRGRRS